MNKTIVLTFTCNTCTFLNPPSLRQITSMMLAIDTSGSLEPFTTSKTNLEITFQNNFADSNIPCKMKSLLPGLDFNLQRTQWDQKLLAQRHLYFASIIMNQHSNTNRLKISKTCSIRVKLVPRCIGRNSVKFILGLDLSQFEISRVKIRPARSQLSTQLLKLVAMPCPLLPHFD